MESGGLSAEAVAAGSVSGQTMCYVKVQLEEIGLDKPKIFSSENGPDQLYEIREDTRVRVSLLPEYVQDCDPDSVSVTVAEYQLERELDPKGLFPFETGMLFREPTENFTDCYLQVLASPQPGKTLIPLRIGLRIINMGMRKGTLLENQQQK